jgi:hypothetical protein
MLPLIFLSDTIPLQIAAQNTAIMEGTMGQDTQQMAPYIHGESISVNKKAPENEKHYKNAASEDADENIKKSVIIATTDKNP